MMWMKNGRSVWLMIALSADYFALRVRSWEGVGEGRFAPGLDGRQAFVRALAHRYYVLECTPVNVQCLVMVVDQTSTNYYR